MADIFNAYHKWLGIPSKDQPPHHYRLLGVELFEADADVISAAADQRMVFLRSFQSGKHAGAAESLLNEIAAARVCLLSPERRESYDRELRAKNSTLPAPRPLTLGAAQQEVALAAARTASGNATTDATALGGGDAQEVPLAPAPLPVRSTVPPPRKLGPLPMTAAVVGASPAGAPAKLPLSPPMKPVGRPAAAVAVKSVLADAPQRLLTALMFVVRLPGVMLFWVLRSADNALLRTAGEDNRILHNFLRVVVPVVLCVALAVGGFFAVRWGGPRVVAALRERAAQQREAAARQLAARPKLRMEFVMQADENPLPPVVPPTLYVPPPITPDAMDPTFAARVDEPLDPSGDGAAPPGPRDRPIYSAATLQGKIDDASLAVTELTNSLDTNDAASQSERVAAALTTLRGLAHTWTYATNPLPQQSDAVDRIARGALDTQHKRSMIGMLAMLDLHRSDRDTTGVMFVGKIEGKRFARGLFETTMQLEFQPKNPVTVLCDQNLTQAFVKGDRVMVLGDIVDRPRESVVHYTGAEPAVIWAGRIAEAFPINNTVASAPIDPVEEPPVEDPAEVADDEPIDPTTDLLALAKFATFLQNSGQALVVPLEHPSLRRWIALGHVARQRRRSWGPEQAEGPPDTADFGDRSTAWASASQDDRDEWLDLLYAETVTPSQVHVVETYHPGALVAVTGFRGDREIDLWRGLDPTSAAAPGGTSVVDVAKPFPTNRLRIYLNSPAVPGWNEIDAVGIVDNRGRTHWAVAVSASTSYAGEDHPQFVIDRDSLIERFTKTPALTKRLLQDPELRGAGNGLPRN